MSPTVRWICPLALASCLRGPALLGDAEPTECDPTFNDHTWVGEATLEQLRARADDPSRESYDVKFIVTLPLDPEHRTVRFTDSSFYRYHDEWYWFRLLNGETACGATTNPVTGLAFDTIDDIYIWARRQDELPLDLHWVGLGTRLYSESFYTLVFRSEPRVYSSGVVRYHPEDDAFELDIGFWDQLEWDEEVAIREALAEALPAPLE